MNIIINIIVIILGILGIFKVFSWLVPDTPPDEWDDEDREKGGWWG